MFKINGNNYYPASFSVTVEDVDFESGRNANGLMVRDKRATKRTLSITMPPMKAAQAAQLLNDISGTSFNVTYYDPYETIYSLSSYTTKTFYPGNRTCTVYYDGAFDGATHSDPDIYYTNQYGHMPYGILYESISFDLVEM